MTRTDGDGSYANGFGAIVERNQGDSHTHCDTVSHLIPEQLLSDCWAGSGYRAQTAVKRTRRVPGRTGRDGARFCHAAARRKTSEVFISDAAHLILLDRSRLRVTETTETKPWLGRAGGPAPPRKANRCAL